jgi:hypothetical protein
MSDANTHSIDTAQAELPPNGMFKVIQIRKPLTALFFTVHILHILLPLKTGFIGGEITYKEIDIAANMPYAEFRTRICGVMELDAHHAELAYKFRPKELIGAHWHPLASEQQYTLAIEKGIGLSTRSRSRKHVMHIKNLVSQIRAYCTTKESSLLNIILSPSRSLRYLQPSGPKSAIGGQRRRMSTWLLAR